MSGVQRRSTTPAPAPTPRWKPWRRSSRCSRKTARSRPEMAFIRAMEYGAIDPEEGTAIAALLVAVGIQC